jgi:hypothetical protein
VNSSPPAGGSLHAAYAPAGRGGGRAGSVRRNYPIATIPRICDALAAMSINAPVTSNPAGPHIAAKYLQARAIVVLVP